MLMAQMLRVSGAIALAVAAVAGRADADVHYVNAAVPGGDGSSWSEAFNDLQSALAFANAGDEVWVAAGIYTPSNSDATASFALAPGVALYGGFAGGETDREQRDWIANETILSGDVGRDDITTPWPGGWNINTPNAGHIVDASGATRDSILDGFTIANGHTGPAGTPAGHPLMYGSGVYIVAGSPTIRNCHFTHNLAGFGSGGGIYCMDGDPLIEHCTFHQNYAHSGGGGAIFVYGDSTPEISHCQFIDNRAVATSVSNTNGDGAGVGIYSNNWVTITDCRFEANRAEPFFGVGDELGYGGGLWVWNGGITVDRCEFINNRANYGAGMIAWGPASVSNSVFRNNTAVVHPNDPYPEQGGDGAGVMVWSFAPAAMDIVNCTIAYNTGKKYIGAVAFWNAELNIHNSIVRNNMAAHPETHGTWKEQVQNFNDLHYSNVAHIFEPHGPGEDPLDPEDMPGVIDADALFVAPSADLHLAAGSPCIDAGDNAAVPAGIAFDLEGNPRFRDDPATDDTGSGAPPLVDMGAYEFQPIAVCPADLTGDGSVGVPDLLALLAAWGACPQGAPCAADLTGDGAVGVSDLLMLLAQWGPCS